MTLKPGMQHLVLGPIIVCSNDDTGLTMTYFTTRSKLVSYAFVLGKMVDIHLRRSAANNWQISTSCLYLVE